MEAANDSRQRKFGAHNKLWKLFQQKQENSCTFPEQFAIRKNDWNRVGWSDINGLLSLLRVSCYGEIDVFFGEKEETVYWCLIGGVTVMFRRTSASI